MRVRGLMQEVAGVLAIRVGHRAEPESGAVSLPRPRGPGAHDCQEQAEYALYLPIVFLAGAYWEDILQEVPDFIGVVA